MTMGATLPSALPLATQLILASARTQRRPEDDTVIRTLVSSGVNWGEVLQQAQVHHITPMIYASLRAVTPADVPADVMASLQERSLQNSQRSIYLARQLILLLKQFEGRGIPAVPYKGPVLAAQAYGSIGLRQFGDLDILIRREDFQRASDLLVECGYQSFYDFAPWADPRSFETHHDYMFVRPADQVVIEIQWTIERNKFIFPITYDTLKDRLASTTIAGVTVPSIGIEQQILMLCVHGSKHAWQRLMWICDIAELMQRYPLIDWAWLLTFADELGGRRMLALGLRLSRDLLGTQLPEWLSQELDADAQAAAIANQITAGLPRSGVSPYEAVGHQRLYHLSLMERLQDRLRLVLRYCRKSVHPVQAAREHGVDVLKRLVGR